MLPENIKGKAELVWARRLVWLYFWLLILEGAFRKWWTPGLSNPLLIVRDPVVLGIYLLAAARGAFPVNGFVVASFFLAGATGLMTMIFGHGNLAVTLFGLRTNFLHLPLIFVIPRLFTLDDVWRFCRAWLLVSLPMAGLVAAQFLALGSHPLNYAVGGTSGQLTGAMGHVRPSGTFSFVTGLVSFLAVQTAFIAAAFFQKKFKLLRTLSLAALVLAVGCSISRSAVVSCALVVAFAVWMMFLQPSKFARGLVAATVFGVMLAVVSCTPLFRYGAEVLNQRFEDATTANQSTAEGLGGRIFSDLLSPLDLYKTVSPFGEGIGIGTNAGAGLVTGRAQFLLAELEWGRLLLESGYVLGTFLIGLRVVLVGYLFYWVHKSLKKDNVMPWLLFASIFVLVLNGQWGQPTALGFASLFAGLALAATRPSYESHPLFEKAAQSLRR